MSCTPAPFNGSVRSDEQLRQASCLSSLVVCDNIRCHTKPYWRTDVWLLLSPRQSNAAKCYCSLSMLSYCSL